MRIPGTSFTLIFLCVILVAVFSCRKKDTVDTNPSFRLAFSTDTVFFDTVFPTIGSITQRLVVHNTNKNKVRIADIKLAGGESSRYRININGTAGTGAADVEIPGGDSIFIFVRVTINPNDQDIPFVVSDSIEFTTNGNYQNVKLVAWGRNAIFYRDATLKGNITWDSLRARVIFGSLRVDTNSTLTILPGAKIYFHKDAWMAVSFGSTMKISGTVEHPVSFQGDRMDPYYRDLPGQWEGIYLDRGSRDHDFNHVVIQNGIFGLSVDSLGSSSAPMLTLSNAVIRNMTSDGIFAYGTSITAVNCVIGDCGGSAIDISYGGSYDFRQVTIANYWYTSVRHSPSVYLSNYAYDTNAQKLPNALSKCYFGNLILYGSNDEEIGLDSVNSAGFTFTFDHAILKTRLKTTDAQRFIGCLVNKDPRFTDISKLDYSIDSISPAINQGIQLNIPYDILGRPRDASPDLGAYEYTPER